MLFFAHFHILKRPLPKFEPDFSSPKHGEFGHREWYDYHVFWASAPDAEITYSSMSFIGHSVAIVSEQTTLAHHALVKKAHVANHIDISKVTHAGRVFSASSTRAHGASVSGTKALGGWSESGSFRGCYDRAFPLDALLGAATFNARNPATYFMAREHLGKLRPKTRICLVLNCLFGIQSLLWTCSCLFFRG